MKETQLKEILNKKNSRPQSSFSYHNLPNLSNRLPKMTNSKKYDDNKEDSFDFKVNLIPKIDRENMYKRNMDLKQEIKDLNKKIDFLKSNNHKLSQIITQKNKEIDDLTNQLILKNKEQLTKEKKEKLSKKSQNSKNSEKSKEKPENKKINKVNIFEKDLQLKKLYNELSITKEEYNKLVLESKNKDDEILNLKRNKKITDYMEVKIKNDILTQEFNKLKEMYVLSLEMNKKSENFGKYENILKAEILTQNDIIMKLNKEIDNFALERKKYTNEIKDLRNKLELSLNNNKLIKNKKNVFEKKFKKNIKEQVIQKEYEQEKKEMYKKMKNMKEKLEYYMRIAQKEKDFGSNPNNKNENKINVNNNVNNNVGNKIIKIERNSPIIVRKEENPEKNYESKIMLLQSIITELINDKKDLMEKLKKYEENKNDIQKENEKEIQQPKENTNLLKTTEEILIGDNSEKRNDEQEENNSKKEEIEEAQENNNGLKESAEEIQNEEKEKEESIQMEEFNFEDIFSLNLEYKKINSSNAKNIFEAIFSQKNKEDFKSESNKESVLNSLVNELSIKLNCNSKEEEKKEIYDNIKIYFEQEENFEDCFNMIFDNVINHEEESRKIIDQDNELVLRKKFKKNKNVIEAFLSNSDNKIRINKFYDVLVENNIYLKKDIFLYLCYKLKTEDCDSLYDIEIKELPKYIE